MNKIDLKWADEDYGSNFGYVYFIDGLVVELPIENEMEFIRKLWDISEEEWKEIMEDKDE